MQEVKNAFDALGETAQNDPVSDPVKKLLTALTNSPPSTVECVKKLGLSHQANFRKNYLTLALHRWTDRTHHPGETQQSASEIPGVRLARILNFQVEKHYVTL